MSKYRRLRERIVASDAFRQVPMKIPQPATDMQLELVHDPAYVQRVVQGSLSDLEIRRIGFPWSQALVERSRRSVGASIMAAESAIEHGISVNLAGGTHHAFADAGQGYCVFNDVMVAAKVVQRKLDIDRVLIVDLDVHQGNGTAAMATGDTSIYTFSMHCEKNYPFRKTAGDLDVGLPERASDETYLMKLEESFERIQRHFSPDLTFYLAGADPFVDDRLGLLSLTKAGLKQRDQMVFDFCRQQGVPLAIAMAGGYANEIEDIVDIHFSTVHAALVAAQNGATGIG